MHVKEDKKYSLLLIYLLEVMCYDEDYFLMKGNSREMTDMTETKKQRL